MEEKKFVQLKKDELAVREFIKKSLGKGGISSVIVEYTPVGERIVVSTDKPGMIIGHGGEKINKLTEILKKKFKLENPHIEIREITKPEFDAQLVADEIASSLEHFGSLKFKVVAYKMMQKIINAGALGVEIRLGGKLPSERAKNWRFAAGYLKKVGDSARIVNRAKSVGKTPAGVIGIKVDILAPDAKIHDQININDELKTRIKHIPEIKIEEKKKKKQVHQKMKTGKQVQAGLKTT
jgi:small subunit ribosomal protein S3